MPAEALRDTDADWRHLGATEPYWGVLTQPDFRRAQMTPEALADFYATGVDEIAFVANEFERLGLGALQAARALDFGCGVGRLTEAMSGRAEAVVGYDISDGMLEVARQRAPAGVSYTSETPAGPFDWINSIIVFQHIPPARGLELLAGLLDRLSPAGALSLQITVWTDERLHPPLPRPQRRPWSGRAPSPAQPVGTMIVYDYDMNAVLRLLNERQIRRLMLHPTNHGGHHGVFILARREEA